MEESPHDAYEIHPLLFNRAECCVYVTHAVQCIVYIFLELLWHIHICKQEIKAFRILLNKTKYDCFKMVFFIHKKHICLSDFVSLLNVHGPSGVILGRTLYGSIDRTDPTLKMRTKYLKIFFYTPCFHWSWEYPGKQTGTKHLYYTLKNKGA